MAELKHLWLHQEVDEHLDTLDRIQKDIDATREGLKALRDYLAALSHDPFGGKVERAEPKEAKANEAEAQELAALQENIANIVKLDWYKPDAAPAEPVQGTLPFHTERRKETEPRVYIKGAYSYRSARNLYTLKVRECEKLGALLGCKPIVVPGHAYPYWRKEDLARMQEAKQRLGGI